MNISIFHYHLNPGGVTRIIESQVAGFIQNYPDARIQVITGHCENIEYYEKLDVSVFINSDLNYLIDKNFECNELQDLFDRIYNWLKSLISDTEILHVHNLNLGKNPVLTMVFNKFLNQGFTLINHAHDFAEDRPNNFAFLQKIIGSYFKKELTQVLYPHNPNYMVGLLNQYDFDRVIHYGVSENHVFLWPNPVFINQKVEISNDKARAEVLRVFNIPAHHKIITYPVRVIQRKNIGELVLLTQLFSYSCTFLVTLAPRNPIEIQFYNNWKDFCRKNQIPVIFEAGSKTEFETIIAGSDYCITTSIKEGFGMAYLEPWLMGTPVIGRNIDYVTSDIQQKGVKFPLLYNELKIPFYNEFVDFKNLNEKRQQAFILQLIEQKQKKQDLFELNEFLASFPPEISKALIIENQSAIKREFSLDKYAKQIFRAYTTIS
ncbi:MAG: hypothetical protein PF517_13405 [Salinivirgaceae bacterium]|jgi:glycosyltransferase involved in cell wall biosynthesis|nr:hypothetical protein [Salinivirgaceae bacterium]